MIKIRNLNLISILYDPMSHHIDCDYQIDQYPWECSCGLLEQVIPDEESRKRFVRSLGQMGRHRLDMAE